MPGGKVHNNRKRTRHTLQRLGRPKLVPKQFLRSVKRSIPYKRYMGRRLMPPTPAHIYTPK